MRTTLSSQLLVLVLGVGHVSCTSYQQQAGLIGGLAGAGLGAAFGDDHQDVIAGAAVGAAVGAGGAAVHEQSRRRQYERYGIPPEESGNNAPPVDTLGPPNDPEPDEPRYPVAQRTANPDEVLSPFPPHHKINVSGFQSGEYAKDPANGRIFLVP